MAEREDDAEYSARLGKTLGGKWKLDRLIGVGGMAAVYAASHRNGAQAAIKILHAHYARRPDARTRFLREAYIANKVGKRLYKKNIVNFIPSSRYQDCFVSKGFEL